MLNRIDPEDCKGKPVTDILVMMVDKFNQVITIINDRFPEAGEIIEKEIKEEKIDRTDGVEY